MGGGREGDRRYLTVIFLRDRIWREEEKGDNSSEFNKSFRYDSLFGACAQNVCSMGKDNARGILPNPDISRC